MADCELDQGWDLLIDQMWVLRERETKDAIPTSGLRNGNTTMDLEEHFLQEEILLTSRW